MTVAAVFAGSPAWVLVNLAVEWKPGLVVLGSQGRSALGRMIFGSVAGVRRATREELVRVVGVKCADAVLAHFASVA